MSKSHRSLCVSFSILLLLLLTLFQGFSRLCYLIVSHWRLSDSKSSQVSWTFFCILANLNNYGVWIVSSYPLISMSSGPFINPLEISRRQTTTISITVIFMFHSFITLKQGLCTYLSFRFLLFSLCVLSGRQSPLFGLILFFLVFVFFYSHIIWSSGWD